MTIYESDDITLTYKFYRAEVTSADTYDYYYLSEYKDITDSVTKTDTDNSNSGYKVYTYTHTTTQDGKYYRYNVKAVYDNNGKKSEVDFGYKSILVRE